MPARLTSYMPWQGASFRNQERNNIQTCPFWSSCMVVRPGIPGSTPSRALSQQQETEKGRESSSGQEPDRAGTPVDIIFIVPSQLRFRAFPESGWGQGCSMSCPGPSHPIQSDPWMSLAPLSNLPLGFRFVLCTMLSRLTMCTLSYLLHRTLPEVASR